jgi:predicted methyltransferase
MHPSASKSRARLPFLLLFLAVLPWLAGQMAAQDKWAKRDAWQRPAEVMDALGIKPRSVVADVGAGEGYFTFRLAARVGPEGKVYAEDILEDKLAKVRARAAKEGLRQIEVILGASNDPRLPAETLDAILVVNAYHEMREYDAMLEGMYRGLKPGGLLVIIDSPIPPGGPRENYFKDHRIPEQLVREDAARNGFRFVRQEPGFHRPENGRSYFFLIFKKPTGASHKERWKDPLARIIHAR